MENIISSPLPAKNKEKNNQDWVGIVILWIMLWIVARRLIVTDWTDHLEYSSIAAFIGFLTGIAVGLSHFNKPIKFLIFLTYGAFFITWLCGLTLSNPILWVDRVRLLTIRLNRIIQELSQNQPVQDNLLFLLLMIILYWLLGIHSGYSYIKGGATWRILIPLFVTITLIHTYDSFLSRRIGYLIVFSFFSLLLIVRLNLFHQISQWKNENLQIPSQFSNDILQSSIRFIILISLLVWVLPTNQSSLQRAEIVWNKIKEPFQSIREDLENAFSSLRVQNPSSPDYYGRLLNLGKGNLLSDDEVFSVLVTEKPPFGMSYYWRARVYTHFENGQWSTSNSIWQSSEPGLTKLQFQRYPDRMPGLNTFYFALNRPILTIFTAPQPQWTNLSTRLELFKNPDNTIDLLSIQSETSLGSGTTYTVRSSISRTTIEKLRSSGENYPQYISERYFQVPDSITARTRDLARQITVNQPTQYDKVLAITNYLRNNISYTDTLDELPQDQDLLDWFLFDAKKGFCNYYASAEVILLRSIGIPARLAVGYAQGKITSPNVYQVLQKDAHAWPEVYFTNIGWVEFEPTSTQPEIIHPETDKESRTENLPSENEKQIQEELRKLQESHQKKPSPGTPATNMLWLVLMSLFILVLAFYSYFNKEKIKQLSIEIPRSVETNLRKHGITPPKRLVNLNRRQMLEPVEKAYLQINTALFILKAHPSPSATPYERANLLICLLPQAETTILLILNEYQNYLFNNVQPNNSNLIEARKELRQLTFRKWLSYHNLWKY